MLFCWSHAKLKTQNNTQKSYEDQIIRRSYILVVYLSHNITNVESFYLYLHEIKKKNHFIKT